MVLGVRKKINVVSDDRVGSSLDRVIRKGFSAEMKLELRSVK